MKVLFCTTVLLLAFLAGCTANGRPAVDAEPPAATTPEPTAPTATETAVPSADATSGAVAPSGTVNVGELTPETAVDTTPQEMPAPGNPREGIVNPALAPLVEAITADLSSYAGVAPDAVRLVGGEPVTWNDAALGCPDPALNYAAVLTEGFQVTLEAEGKRYTYHTDADRHFVLCVDGRPASSGAVGE